MWRETSSSSSRVPWLISPALGLLVCCACSAFVDGRLSIHHAVIGDEEVHG